MDRSGPSETGNVSQPRSESQPRAAGSRAPAPSPRGRRAGALAALLLPPLLVLAFGVALALPGSREAARRAIAEDGPVEWATFTALLAGGVIAAVRLRRSPRAPAPRFAAFRLLLAGGLAVLAMEEISWGQRLLGFSTPRPLERVNVQEEFNLHNLAGIDSAGELALVAISLAALLSMGLRTSPRYAPLAAPALLASCFATIVAVTGLDLVTYQVSIHPTLDDLLVPLVEVAELLLGIGLLGYAAAAGRGARTTGRSR